MSVKIISDSTCDLSKELVEKYNISILPLHIVLGEAEYKDGEEIGPDEIYKWADENKTTPKTSAIAITDVMDAYEKWLKDYDEIVSFSISGKMSTTVNVMRMGADELEVEDRVFVVDSENLSTGSGLLVIEAAIMAQEGKNAKEIVTKYRVIAEAGGNALLEVELLTGRTHQIRAHLSHIGHPLVGDGKYGVNKDDRKKGYKYQALCSYKLRFAFKTDAGVLNYLNGKEFSISKKDVYFTKEFFER